MEDQTNQQAPSTLLTAIHAQLGPVVSPDAARLPTETLLADLKAADWRKRLSALHLLAERESAVPPAELRTLLDDEDLSVRAAGLSVPTGRLEKRLDGAQEFVRESAGLALRKAKQEDGNIVSYEEAWIITIAIYSPVLVL